MCWYSYNKLVRRIANKDITCWKVVHLVNSGFKSIYYGKLYEIHKRYSIHDGLNIHEEIIYSFFTPTTTCYEIHEGFHSYNNKVFIKEDSYQRIIMNENKKILYDKFYIFYNTFNLHVIKCIIPEGSIYYENENGELVSSSIKIIGLDED